VISREIVVERSGASIVARPRAGGGCLYRYELDYGAGAPIVAQAAEWDSGEGDSAETYAREVAPARTFCLESEARAMQAAGLFKGLSPRDLLVIGERGPIENQYRFENEPARHKLLDLIGDLALAGRPLVGEVVATRAGHALNHEMAVALARL
jgi:UDP-3-O-acyl-N-acetylglucosamine deacetylase